MTISRLLSYLTLAMLLALVGCSTRQPASVGVPSSVFYHPLTDQQAEEMVVHAIGLIGTPYVGAGNTPAQGFDCSGLISYVYSSVAGVAPPRRVRDLHHFGQAISTQKARSGDLVLFGPKGGTPTHAGIYIGEGRFVHAPSSGGRVRMEYVNGPYWSGQNPRFRRL